MLESGLIALLAGRRGHFRMESGYHSELWFELDRLFRAPDPLRPYVLELARRIASHRPEMICGPVSGGAKLAEWVARELRVDWCVTERSKPLGQNASPGLFPIRYQLRASERERVRTKRVAIVDDGISAGSAVRGSLTELVECGAEPVALGALFIFGEAADRFAADRGLALEAIARLKFGMWNPAECPLCAAGAPLETVSDAA